MKAAGKEIKPGITEVRAEMASTSVNESSRQRNQGQGLRKQEEKKDITSVNEGSRQRNQAKDYGSESRNGVYFRK